MRKFEFEEYILICNDSERIVGVVNIDDPIKCVQLRTPMPWWLVREVIWCYEYPLDMLQSIDEFFRAVGIECIEDDIEAKFFDMFWIFENRKKKK